MQPDPSVEPYPVPCGDFVVVKLHVNVYEDLRRSKPESVQTWLFDSVPIGGTWRRLKSVTLGAEVEIPQECYLESSGGTYSCAVGTCGGKCELNEFPAGTFFCTCVK